MAGMKTIVVIVLVVMRGCVPLEPFGGKRIPPEEAAKAAASLANDECEEHYKRRPFSPENYEPVFRDNRWRWGKFDPAGIHGYSAEVSFKKDGSHPKVEVFFSSDALEPDSGREDLIEWKWRQILPPERLYPPIC
ncbi:MAG: hypothetical protein Q8Q12_12000 [bacterium]|nr:hypothetical protein [bacterium]